jgi:2-polyprenyl-3-methyl-5-hydroxy-6-metoxy-1,4-benzoquinol methylase
MQERHTDRSRYFEEQARTTEKYYIPYLISHIGPPADKVLEVGCGEGGNLLPFARMGCEVTGVDFAVGRIEEAKEFFARHGQRGEFVAADVLTMQTSGRRFPLIIVHDVIEHIADKAGFLGVLRDILSVGGRIFIAFPSWRMPFGGHQQIARGRVVSHLPFVHLLPMFLYRAFLHMMGERTDVVEELSEIKRTRCTINGFIRLVRLSGLRVVDRQLYFINPHYETKFGLRPRRLWNWLALTPFLRDYFTTTCFFIVEKGSECSHA